MLRRIILNNKRCLSKSFSTSDIPPGGVNKIFKPELKPQAVPVPPQSNLVQRLSAFLGI